MSEMPEKLMTRDEAMTPLLTRALKDPEYRKRLKTDPKSVIQGEFGVALPESLEIEVVEETAQKLYVVIPPRPAEGELSDEQLEAVAGGLCFPVIIPFIPFVGSVAVKGFSVGIPTVSTFIGTGAAIGGTIGGAHAGWGQGYKFHK